MRNQQEAASAPKVKICGITTMREADWLNAAGADYAGFVFYEKSKRNVSMMDAVMIKKSLYPSVKTVAVTVSPTVEQLQAIEIAGFDILQVHKTLSLEVLRECKLPIWRAFNIGAFSDMSGTDCPVEVGTRQTDTMNHTGGQTESRMDGADQAVSQIESRMDGADQTDGQAESRMDAADQTDGQPQSAASEDEQAERARLEDALIEAYVLDGVEFGSGKTFDWSSGSVAGIKALFGEKKLVLAGGLTPSNVAEGIKIFRPDIVDVSSGVEKEFGSGKDEEKIQKFISEVRKNE